VHDPLGRGQPTHAVKEPSLLGEAFGPDGAIDPAGVDRVVEAVNHAMSAARRLGVEQLYVFTTSGRRAGARRVAGHDYGQYVRDAENAGLNDIAQFFRDTMKDDSARAARAHDLLKNISGTDQAGPAAQ
jgi:hypothetical protein